MEVELAMERDRDSKSWSRSSSSLWNTYLYSISSGDWGRAQRTRAEHCSLPVHNNNNSATIWGRMTSQLNTRKQIAQSRRLLFGNKSATLWVTKLTDRPTHLTCSLGLIFLSINVARANCILGVVSCRPLPSPWWWRMLRDPSAHVVGDWRTVFIPILKGLC